MGKTAVFVLAILQQLDPKVRAVVDTGIIWDNLMKLEEAGRWKTIRA